ncbi:unnamed protein product [Allacma fusca]|uniref:Uncharacterized protein n=1 Tax=Allacma fusca TaxID=39272 RepID=A0A8J2LIH3_9HEXA|nr:unnamed protein product [Allacma fusca]
MGNEETSKNKGLKPEIQELTFYKYGCMVQVQGVKPVFDVKFHLNLKPGEPNIFAAVGSKRVTIFQCVPEGKIKVLQNYSDSDDTFYCCAWSSNPKGEPILAAAGERGCIRLLSPGTGECFNSLRGHPNSINDMLFHPRKPELVLTASKDHSLRLWNTVTSVLVAIFGGVDGHRDEILTLDFNIDGTRIVSGGMDHAIKIWNLNKPEILLAIEKSTRFIPKRHSKAFPTVTQHVPDFTTRNIHGNYVDCVRWFGNFIISKSVQNQIQIWKAGWPLQPLDEITPSETHSTIMATLGIEDCTIWYIRFCMDSMKKILALGNENGHIFVM